KYKLNLSNSLLLEEYFLVMEQLDSTAHTHFYLNLSANSIMIGRVHARRTLKGLVADLKAYNKGQQKQHCFLTWL
ncbi:MAG: hypothetical protein U0I89_04935, partial [Prevotella sp.]|nr:hypothetical protein [Prevotella sp.]